MAPARAYTANAMDRPLRDHIAYLEEKIESLRTRQNDISITAGERYQAVEDIRIAESALAYFRHAYALEQRVQKISD